jgi:Ser/Thr protein kinase RdoA (MazF antagonist)
MSEYAKVIPKYVFRGTGVPIKQWLAEHPRFRKHIIHNMHLILVKIRTRFPSFRHMDLHARNVMYDGGRLKIRHFKHARLDPTVPVGYDMKVFEESLEESAADIARRLTS